MTKLRFGAYAGGLVSWLLLIAAGFFIIERYAITPGAMAESPTDWPSSTSLVRATDRPTLLMFAHPQCPCTSSSFEELNRTLARLQDTVQVTIVFTLPKAADASWRDSDLYRAVSKSTRMKFAEDIAGREAQRFGVHTSGNVLLYDKFGRLLFNGGITAARGHDGDNDGRDSLERVIRQGTDKVVSFPVFGCGLVRADQKAEGASQ